MGRNTGSGPAGRPPRGHAKITELDYPNIYTRFCKGATVFSLAAQYKVDWSTMNHHLQKCRTMMKMTMVRERNEVLDELALIRSEAWECFNESKKPLTHEEITKELERIAAKKKVSKETAGQVVRNVTRVTMRDGEANWQTVILAAIDLECKLTGHYETGKREGQKSSGKGTYRAAGRGPKETHEVMAQRLNNILNERREALTTGVN